MVCLLRGGGGGFRCFFCMPGGWRYYFFVDGGGASGFFRRGLDNVCCHGVMVSTPGPTSRRRQLPAVPAGAEWHNNAASATPCAMLREPPPPFPRTVMCTPHGMGSYRADHTSGPPCRSLCIHGPQCIQFCQSNKFCMGTHPMPLISRKVINFAWAQTQYLQFREK